MEIILVIIKYIIYAIWTTTKTNSIKNDIADIKHHIRYYEYYVKIFNYCLENKYEFNILFFGLHCMDINCIPASANDNEYNIHLTEQYDTYITTMCIQLDESYVLAISPLKTLFDQEINEVWKYNRDNHSKFIITILADYYSGKLDYYKKILKIRSKYGML